MKVYAKPELRLQRIKAGLTALRFADLLHITKQSVWLVERRKNGISPEKAQEVLKILPGCTWDDLFEFVERGSNGVD